MKAAVSVPDDVDERAERAASRLGRSRSALYAEALREYLDRHEQPSREVTARLDELFTDVNGDNPAAVGRAAGRLLVDQGDWEW